MRTKTAACTLTIALSALGLSAGTASAATTVGQTFVPTSSFGGSGAFIQTASPGSTYTMPTDGVITSWSYQATASDAPPMKMKITQLAGGTLASPTLRTVGESALADPVPSVLNTFPTRVSVKAGDFLGIYYTNSTDSHTDAVAGFDSAYITPPGADDIPPGTSASYTDYPQGKIDVSAQLEPDADGDGFGDESQDQCPSQADTQGQCRDLVAPQTTIGKAPKKKVKTKRKKAKVKFTFSSSESGSTFTCNLDGDKSGCTSPFKAKVATGKHTFTVVAKDAAGNVDSSPATIKFKVKRKRK